MKILMIGAGVLGSNMAHHLQKKHDVTLLVRGDTCTSLRENGLVIRHKPFGRKTVDRFPLVTTLNAQDTYDLVIVPVRFSQLGETFEMIRNSGVKNVLFVGNNMNAEEIRLPGKNLLFGFFSAAGYRHDGMVDSISLNKITVGACDGREDSDDFLKDVFDGTGIRMTLQNRMGDWLKVHGMAILPLVFACYRCDGNLKVLAKDKVYSMQIIEAVKEGYDVLQALGYEILPEGEYETTVKKKKLCAWMYRFLFSNWIGQTCISDHAMHAQDEMLAMLKCFDELRAQSGLETPVFDELRKNSGFETFHSAV